MQTKKITVHIKGYPVRLLAGWWKGCPSYWGGSCSLLAQEGTKALIPGLQKNGKQRSQEPRHSPLAFLGVSLC